VSRAVTLWVMGHLSAWIHYFTVHSLKVQVKPSSHRIGLEVTV
jgi:hypothetical protein